MMGISKAKVYLVKLDFTDLSSAGYENEILLKGVPHFRKEKFSQYVRIEDKLRCLYSWKLLEKAMQDVFSLDMKKEIVSIDAYGKPFIANKNDIHFNLSHSGEIVTCVVDTYPAGIDVENITPIDLTIASSFFSKEECHDLFNLPHNEQGNYFFKLWALKESYIKSEGKGLSIPLNSFSLKIDNNLIDFEGANQHKWDFALHDVNTDNQNYQLGLCAHKGRLPDSIIEVSYKNCQE